MFTTTKIVTDYTCKEGQSHAWFFDKTIKVVVCRRCGKKAFKKSEEKKNGNSV